MVSPRVGLILNGCGFKDGSEIHESVLALLALEEAGAVIKVYAIDAPQTAVIDHLTGKVTGESRNMLRESARIARGQIQSLDAFRSSDVDAVVIPGGFGAATNLCDFGSKGAEMTVHPRLAACLRELHEEGKPIGAICIAPVILAKVFGHLGCRITIGQDVDTAHLVQRMGAVHINCPVDDIVLDLDHKLVTTPAYMLGPSIKDIHKGIRMLADQVVHLAKRH